jgi:hypothetical protein
LPRRVTSSSFPARQRLGPRPRAPGPHPARPRLRIPTWRR